MGGRLREHAPLLIVLALGLALRVATAIAYRPALFYSDSWEYGGIARFHSFAGVFVPGFDPVRPSGYPLLLDAISVVSRAAIVVTSVQHLAGLVVGVIVYAAVRRVGGSRLIAAGATAIVVLDSYAIALEQHILSEAFFGLLLLASMFAATHREGGWISAALSGLLLALAVMTRTAAVFAIPIWFLYLLFARSGKRPALAAAVALILPMLLYAGAQAAAGQGFGVGPSGSGWFLYSRTAELADCSRFTPAAEERFLCEDTPEQYRNPVYYMWSSKSPAWRRFGDPANLPEGRAEAASSLLRGFALKTIASRPGAYLELVGGDLLHFFIPGRMSPHGSLHDRPVILPRQPRDASYVERHGDEYFAVSAPPDVHPPAGALVEYQQWVHTPRWLLGAFGVAGVLALLIGLRGRAAAKMSRRWEVFLLVGGPLAILLGTVATSVPFVRYLVPEVPLLICGGIAAVLDLVAVARAGRASRAPSIQAASASRR